MKRIPAMSICLMLLFSSISVCLGASNVTEEIQEPRIEAAALSPGPGPQPGTQTYYTDRTTFDADTGPLPFFEDFEEGNENATGDFGGTLDQYTDNGYFKPGDIEPGIRFQDNPGPDSDGLFSIGIGWNGSIMKEVGSNNFPDSLDIFFFNNDVWAVGMDLQRYLNPTTFDITIYGVGGVILDTTTAPANNVGIFWGVISDELITRINLYSLTETDGADNIAFGEPSATVDHIEVTPSPVTITVGDTQQFTATAYDQFNNTIPGASFIWSTDIGSIDSTGLFTAQTSPGNGTVTATNGTVTGTANVNVAVGPIDHIIITPDPVTTPPGEPVQFNATAYDLYNNIITDVIYIWGTDVGTVNATGYFIAQSAPGVGIVTATNGTHTGYAMVNIVAGPIDHIVVIPDPITVICGSNDTQVFTAIAFDTYNNTIPGVDFNWTSNVWNETGVVILPPGSVGWVNATNGSVTGSATVHVIAGPIHHIIVCPDPVIIVVGGTQWFTANAYDVYNNYIPAINFIWTTDVGTINSTGFFTAQTIPATGTVTATNGTISGSATVIIFGCLGNIVVTPDPATVIVGDTQQFTATAYDQYNNVIPGVNFTWTTDVGSITQTGLFTAQNTSGFGIVEASAPSCFSGHADVAVVGQFFNIDLTIGWNLISIPVEQSSTSIDHVLGSIDGKWDSVQAYDAINHTWLSNCTYKPDPLNTLKTLNHKMGFWVHITAPNVTLTVAGIIPTSTSINLYAGWNLVGYPSMTDETVANALWGTGADQVMVCDTSEPYNIKEGGPTYVMRPGEGYWVHVSTDTTWTINW